MTTTTTATGAVVEFIQDARVAAFPAEALTIGKRCIVDKMPSNFRFLGLIRRALPEAAIVHVRRDAEDTCLSMFRTYFTGDTHPYAYDLAELGGYYRLYAELMQHWRGRLGPALHEVSYEDLVGEPEPVVRALLGHVGLDWDAAVLSFHAGHRTVRTASVAQVRRPIYRSSVSAAARYAAHLAPLRAALSSDEE